ncbi:MAG: anchored repeat ABC transporter, substrate-binding protein, partial [Dermatophilaceae bacterium]
MSRRMPPHRAGLAAVLATALAALTGCAAVGSTPAEDGVLRVVTTTGILADLVREVAGPDVEVTALVPDGADPHSFEPTLGSIRDVVRADVAFSNYLMLEERSVISAIDANLAPGARHVFLAEAAPAHGAEVITLVEQPALDSIWLGVRVQGTPAGVATSRASEVRIRATEVDGPGDLAAYLTETFGRPHPYVSSADGITPDAGEDVDSITLPTAAHTHMSWAFTRPGIYRLGLSADLAAAPDTQTMPVATGTLTFAVGVDPRSVPELRGAEVLDHGHADVTVDLSTRRLMLRVEDQPDSRVDTGEVPAREIAADDAVVAVPSRTLTTVPADPAFRFIARPGTPVHQLPQSVLGRHV